ncbi:MAG: UDP-N-acetylmuramoyl-tripeptide--D-alanyl-D-alanine ligase [Bacteroidetes bacterium]|nr:UDP-N-acetylmuramoyl-tripeptide--D-alanyl-D-alanine ligase [Bacteroidota bacterium]
MKFRSATNISTDSRTVGRGEVFFALRGEKFDGHNFVSTAVKKGAACAVVDRKWYRGAESAHRFASGFPLVVVNDTTRALADLAHIYRQKFDMPVIAVGGSNGKTTTKELIAKVLGRKFKVFKTKGNHNNQIGVPLTIFGFKENHEAAVVEIGTNHPGEIERLCEVLSPSAGVITNIGAEHLEFFKNISGVRREEGKLFASLARSGGTAFINTDDRLVAGMPSMPRRRFNYGFHSSSRRHVAGKLFGFDNRGCAVFEIKFEGKTELVHLGVPGIHNATNALAAAAVGFRYGVPHPEVREALESFRSYDKRMQIVKMSGVTILNDTYNSNSESAVAALHWLSTVRAAGKKIAILADMLELGGASAREHEKVGKEVAAAGIDKLFTFGKMARRIADIARGRVETESFDDKLKLLRTLLQTISSGDVILVKGSRGMKMEEVVEGLVHGLKSGRTR